MKMRMAAALTLMVVCGACEKQVKPGEAASDRTASSTADQQAASKLDFERRLAMRDPPHPLSPQSDADKRLLRDFEALHPGVLAAPDGFKKTVNHSCPIMQKHALGQFTMAEHTVEFEGQTVGFCCDDCPETWKLMSDDERRAALKAVTGKK